MVDSTLQREALRPKSADGTSRGLMLAALVHVGLLIAIAFGVSWNSSAPEGVEAELWAAVPQVAAQRDIAPEPPKPVPTPTPKPEPRPEPKPEPKVERPDPQIAIEKAKQEKLKKKQEEEKREREEKEKEKEKLDKKRAQEEKAKLSKAEAERQKKIEDQRAANLARIKDMMGADAGSPGGTAARSAGPSAGYAGRIIARIKPNIVFPDMISGNPAAVVDVRLGPDGTIISRKIKQSSGVKEWDDAVLRALDRTEVLPRDTDGTVPPQIDMTFRPRDLS